MLTLLAMTALAAPAPVALEGTELVYRAAPGQTQSMTVSDDGRSVRFSSGAPNGAALTPGAGCEAVAHGVRCAKAGVTALRLVGGDGDDLIDAEVELPVIAELGAGFNQLDGRGPVLTYRGVEGADHVEFDPRSGTIDLGPGDDDVSNYGVQGALRVDGGDGNDRIDLVGKSAQPGTAVSGGPGDDFLVVDVRGPAVDIACGDGADHVMARIRDRVGDGCAPQLVGITPKAVSRVFREGALTAPASGSVTYARLHESGTLFRGRFESAAGPLRVPMHATKAGRRWLRAKPRRVRVVVDTRSGGDRLEVDFAAKLG